jgi:class 3 adenylate cyclase/tetratricopeptide (TPR) repeat protein
VAEIRGLAAIMVTDMVGYSALTQRDEALTLRLLTEYRRVVRQSLAQFGGREVKTMGDGFLVEFDSALNAALSAIEIQRHLDERNREPGRERIELRIALHVGDVVREGGDVYGDTVNIASRLEPLSESGGILVSGPVFEQVRGKIDYPLTQIPTPSLKNLSFPVPAYKIDLPWRVSAASRLTPWTDRDTELEVLRQSIEEARHGDGRLVLIRGEAGVGKTRLATQALREAERSGFRVLHGRAFRGDEGSPYGPWVQAIREFTRSAPSSVLARSGGAYAEELAELVPELGHRVVTAREGPRPEPDAARVRLLEALTQFFADLSNEAAPLAVFLDDLHWADAASQKLLLLLARQLPGHRILLVSAYREADPRETPGFPRLLLDLRREQPIVTITLKRFGPADVDRLLEGSLAGQAPPDDARRLVYERSGGNPFFVEELARRLVDDGTLTHSNGGWKMQPLTELRLPDTVRTLLQERLERLDQPTLQLLRVASMAGPTFSFELLQRIVDLNEEELLISLERALEARVLEERPLEPGRVELAFRDLQTQEVLREDLSRVRGRQYHRRIAEALEAIDPQARGQRAGEIAHHYLEATEPGKALEYLELAGEQASRVYAHADAARSFELATELVEESPDVGRRARLLERLGDARYAEGQVEAGRREWRKAAELFRGLGDRSRAGDLYRRVAWSFWEGTDEEVPFREAYAKALELLRADPAAGTQLARLLGGAGMVFAMWGDPIGARQAAEQALDLARRIGLPDVESTAHLALANITPIPEKKAALEHVQKAAELASPSDPSEWFEAQEHLFLFQGHLTGGWADVEKACAELIEEARRRRLPMWERHLSDISGGMAAGTGHVDLARRRLHESEEIATRLGSPAGAVGTAMSTILLMVVGDLDGAEQQLVRAMELFEHGAPRHTGVIGCYSGRGLITLERGDPSGAIPWLERALRLLEESGRTVWNSGDLMNILDLLVRAHLLLGQTEPARARLTELRTLATEMETPAFAAFAKRAQGRFSAREGDTETATRSLAEAAAIWEGLEFLYDQAETLELLGSVYRDAKSPEEARGAFVRALELFQGMGARRDAERVLAQLQSVS